MLLLLWKILPNDKPNYRHFCHSQYATLTSSTLIAIQVRNRQIFHICPYATISDLQYGITVRNAQEYSPTSHQRCDATCRAGFRKIGIDGFRETIFSNRSHLMGRHIWVTKSIQNNCKNRDIHQNPQEINQFQKQTSNQSSNQSIKQSDKPKIKNQAKTKKTMHNSQYNKHTITNQETKQQTKQPSKHTQPHQANQPSKKANTESTTNQQKQICNHIRCEK